MLLPLSRIRKLQTSIEQKLGLSICFCLGIIIVIVAIVRAVQVLDTSTHGDQVRLAFWGIIESTVCTSFVCRVLIRPHLDPIRSFAFPIKFNGKANITNPQQR